MPTYVIEIDIDPSVVTDKEVSHDVDSLDRVFIAIVGREEPVEVVFDEDSRVLGIPHLNGPQNSCQQSPALSGFSTARPSAPSRRGIGAETYLELPARVLVYAGLSHALPIFGHIMVAGLLPVVEDLVDHLGKGRARVVGAIVHLQHLLLGDFNAGMGTEFAKQLGEGEQTDDDVESQTRERHPDEDREKSPRAQLR